MKAAHPYLNFPGNTEEAFEFYRSVIGGEFSAVVRFRDFGGNGMSVDEDDLDKIAHIGLPLGEGNYLMATDTLDSMPKTLTMGTNVYITLEPENADEAKRLFDGLSDGGEVQMPLQRTEWAELHGSLTDRFGVQWMIDFAGEVQFGG